MSEKTQHLAPVVVRPGLAWAARFAALIAIAALCVWVDGATRVLALADYAWDVATGPVDGSWPPVVFHNNPMALPAAGVVWLTWFGMTSRAWWHSLPQASCWVACTATPRSGGTRVSSWTG